MTTSWVTSDDLQTALGETTFTAIYDEDGGGVADAEKVALDIRRANSKVNAALLIAYGGVLPTAPLVNQDLILDAALEHATGYAADRRPEYYKKLGTESHERAEAILETIIKSARLASPEATRRPSMGDGSAPADLLPTFVVETCKFP